MDMFESLLSELGFHFGFGFGSLFSISTWHIVATSRRSDLLDCHRLDGPHQLGERFASGRSVAEVAITGPVR